MKQLLIVVCSLFAATAFAKDPPKDPNCDKVASFARGIATIKAAGYDMAALSNFVSEPKAQTFPLQVVKQQIYAQDLAPDLAYTKFYGQCMAVGYDALFEYFNHEQERQQLELDNTLLKADNVSLQGRITALNDQIATLQASAAAANATHKPLKHVSSPTIVTPQPAPNRVYGTPTNPVKR